MFTNFRRVKIIATIVLSAFCLTQTSWAAPIYKEARNLREVTTEGKAIGALGEELQAQAGNRGYVKTASRATDAQPQEPPAPAAAQAAGKLEGEIALAHLAVEEASQELEKYAKSHSLVASESKEGYERLVNDLLYARNNLATLVHKSLIISRAENVNILITADTQPEANTAIAVLMNWDIGFKIEKIYTATTQEEIDAILKYTTERILIVNVAKINKFILSGVPVNSMTLTDMADKDKAVHEIRMWL